ncbi:type III secretion system inner rod subunit SctI [Pseudomonas aeruginosa]|nr:type III secretion system inner rod subunit SctI [Pseudomonas aeruginosa]
MDTSLIRQLAELALAGSGQHCHEEALCIAEWLERLGQDEAARLIRISSLGGDLLSELGQIRERFSQAKQELQVELSTPGDDPNSLMQMQWSLMRITMQEELIAKTVGRMSQNVETLMKTQ